MLGNDAIISTLNKLLTEELTAADQYFIHSRIFQDWGMNVLYERFKHEQEEELEHASRLIERILFLDGMPDVGSRSALNVGKTLPEMLKNDLDYELAVGTALKSAIAECETASDYVSRNILLDLLTDTEEDHTHWLEQQLKLIERMGLENYCQSVAS